MTEIDLRETLEQHVGGVDVPPADPMVAIGRGRRRQRRRRWASASAAVVVLAGVAGTSVAVLTPSGPGGSDGASTARYASVGPLDFSQGARAYAAPGAELHLAGRTFPYGDLDYLDTDAVATSYGVVFFDSGRPMLLGTDGEVRALVDGPVDDPEGFHPTAKTDSVNPWVAYATRRGITTTVTVHDLATGRDVASTPIDCPGCTDFVIEALDHGVVYVRIDQLTRAWDVSTGRWEDVSDGGSRVVDVRGGVMLYEGKPPADLGLVRVEAPIDAQLTFDGRYVLDWSSRLRSTDGSPDLVLEQGPTKRYGPGFWAIDSDGSVLVARPDDASPGYQVYDCAVPTGACEELGPLVTEHGDPLFIGVDM